MEGRRLILNDETVIEGGQAGYFSGFLWLWLPGLTMQNAATIAFDADKTERITFQYGEMQDEYEGFTRCIRLMEEEYEIAVCLTKGVE